MERYFEWDTAKAAKNFKKHKISFVEAATVFKDPFAMTEQDRVENGEYRWKTLGMTSTGEVLLLVAHTVLEDEHDFETIRIISARLADRKERTRYGNR